MHRPAFRTADGVDTRGQRDYNQDEQSIRVMRLTLNRHIG